MIPPISAETLAKLRGKTVVASISGGKDSAAMALWLMEHEIEFRRVFMDTGWENKITYDYLRGPLTKKLGAIEEIGVPGGMVALVAKKGMFPSRVRRFCTQELKVFPMKRYIEKMADDGHEAINTVGIRAAESQARAKMTEWEWNETFDCEVWRPLIRWTEQDVIDIHTRHGLAPNPLYLRGASRVGCWPCVFARKSEIRLIADTDPETIDKIRALEAATAERAAERAAERYAAKGETFDSLGFVKRAFFQQKTGRGGAPWPIDEVVKWSRTTHGGKQYDMFDVEESDAGCMRWGLCEQPKDG